MNLNLIISYLIGIGVCLFLFDFQVVGSLITTSRLGFISILIAFIFEIYKGLFKINIGSGLIIFSVWLTFIAVLLSSLYNNIFSIQILSWVFVVICVSLLSYILSNKANYDKTIGKIGQFSFLTILFLFAYCVYNFGIFAFTESTLRYEVNELGPGLSRIVNGVVFANVLVIIYYSVTKSRLARYMVYIGLLLSFWFVFSGQSRQGLLTLVFLLIAVVSASYASFRYKKLGLILVITFLSFVTFKIYSSEVFLEHFLQRTQNQLENDEGSTGYRIYLYKVGFNLIENNFIMGIGPGEYLKQVGKTAHSGYLAIVVETGVLSLFSIILIWFSSFLNIARKYKFRSENISFWLLIPVLIAPFFNTIINTPMFWVVLIIIFSMNNYYIKFKISEK